MWPEHPGQALQASGPSEGSPHPVIAARCALADPQAQAGHTSPVTLPRARVSGRWLVIPDREEKVGLETSGKQLEAGHENREEPHFPASTELWPHLKIGLHDNSGHARLSQTRCLISKNLQLSERGKKICLPIIEETSDRSSTRKRKLLFLISYVEGCFFFF